jgi:hypothetical protein
MTQHGVTGLERVKSKETVALKFGYFIKCSIAPVYFMVVVCVLFLFEPVSRGRVFSRSPIHVPPCYLVNWVSFE